jgi:hypothetical protein
MASDFSVAWLKFEVFGMKMWYHLATLDFCTIRFHLAGASAGSVRVGDFF